MARVRVIGANRVFHGGRGSSERFNARKDLFGQDMTRAPEIEDVPDTGASADVVKALDDVNLEIADGETVSIVGPSGCGKTTLLRVVSGLEPLDSGRVFYDDQDVTDVQPKDRGIGIVFQNYALYPHMDSKKNLSFFFWMHKRDKEIDERVRITSEIMGVGFDQLLERKPKELSGGQRQRVAIGRCIVRDPRLFLFDEPLSNLDARLRSKTRVEIKRLLSRFKITAIYVTHDQVEAIALGDRIVVMRRGHVEQVGPYREIYDHPINAFVGGFVGIPPMNQIKTVVEDGAARVAGGSAPLSDAQKRLVRSGQEVIFGVRPEHVALGSTTEVGHLRGVVDVVEPIHSDRRQIVHLQASSGDADTRRDVEIVANVPIEVQIGRGDLMSITFDPSNTHFFDSETGRNLQYREEHYEEHQRG